MLPFLYFAILLDADCVNKLTYLLTQVLVELLRPQKWPFTALWVTSRKFGTVILVVTTVIFSLGHNLYLSPGLIN
jgi:hypothetical protein